ncbi:MAG: hypothetical protein AAF193_08910 [Bacteroidota bacterium]
MKRLFPFIVILAIGCSTTNTASTESQNESTASFDFDLDTLEAFVPGKNEWVETRTYPDLWLGPDYNGQKKWNDGGVLFHYNYFYHQPRVFDDQHGYDLYINIADTAQIETMTDYEIPSPIIQVKATWSGARTGYGEFFNIHGKIRFETFSMDTTRIKTCLQGSTLTRSAVQSNCNIMCQEITMIREGREDWEWKSEYNINSGQDVFETVEPPIKKP